MTRILIDAAHTARTQFNTGIQRVVRRVAQCSQRLQDELGAACIPVRSYRGRIYQAPQVAGLPGWDHRLASRIRRDTTSLLSSIHAGVSFFSPAAGRDVQQLAVRCRKALYPRSLVRAAASGVDWLLGREIKLNQSDILLMLDTSWESRPVLYELAEKHGCFVAQVVYDLLPVTHAQYFAPNIVSSYGQWIAYACEHVDCFWAISQTVRDELVRHYQLQRQPGDTFPSTRARPLTPDRFRTFRLGADLMSLRHDRPPRAAIRTIFAEPTPAFFSVGTIEPRKNHLWLLNAFDRFWEEGGRARLVLAGRVGWNSQQIVHRIERHPQFGTRLFWFPDARDEEIQYMYRHARATAYCSRAEGFGLPIVESLHQGTDVLASDTPIHREVGGHHVTYFSLDVLDDLVRKISVVARSPKVPRPDARALVPTWDESAEQLLRDLLQVARQVHSAPAAQVAA